MRLKYKYSKSCTTCKYLWHKRSVKSAMANELAILNNGKGLDIKNFHRKYSMEVEYQSFLRHCQKHIFIVEDKPQVTLTSFGDKKAIQQAFATPAYAGRHEQALDEYINQFYAELKDKSLTMTVKDGLQAIKIKADIESKKRDDKKDVLKMLMGTHERAGSNSTQPAG